VRSGVLVAASAPTAATAPARAARAIHRGNAASPSAGLTPMPEASYGGLDATEDQERVIQVIRGVARM